MEQPVNPILVLDQMGHPVESLATIHLATIFLPHLYGLLCGDADEDLLEDDPWSPSSWPLSWSPLPFFSTTSDRGASSSPLSSFPEEFDFGGKFKSASGAAAVAALSGEPAPNPEDRPGLLLAAGGADGGGAEETRLVAEGLICWALR